MNRLVAAVVAGLTMATTAAQATSQAPDLVGRVTFAGVGVPGATVTATRDERTFSTLTTDDGTFKITKLDVGVWMLRVEMRGFVPVSREITIPADGPPPDVTLTMRSFAEIVGSSSTTATSAARPAATAI